MFTENPGNPITLTQQDEYDTAHDCGECANPQAQGLSILGQFTLVAPEALWTRAPVLLLGVHLQAHASVCTGLDEAVVTLDAQLAVCCQHLAFATTENKVVT